jgi:hypothetical protein
MRMRTTVSIALLASAFIAVPLYFATRPDSAPDVIRSPGEPASALSPDHELLKLYCARRSADGDVIVNTGPDCARYNKPNAGGPTALSITRDGGTIVITGSDP